MDKPDESEKILALMRQHFVDDPEENLEHLHECSALMSQDPASALKKVHLVLHNMKGSAQAVGFQYFAALLHDMEEVVSHLSNGPDMDLAFTQLIEAVEVYFQSLRETMGDQAGWDHEARRLLDLLRSLEETSPSQAPAGWGLFEDTPASEPMIATPASDDPVETAKQAMSGKYLLLENNHRLFAIHLDDVKEIVSDHFLNPLPVPRQGLKGMIVVRNRALPVIDLGAAMDGQTDGNRICAVICESAEQSFAFRVQKARQVISLGADDFESIAEKTVLQLEQQNLIKNVARFHGQSVLIVDLKSMWAA